MKLSYPEIKRVILILHVRFNDIEWPQLLLFKRVLIAPIRLNILRVSLNSTLALV